MFFSLKQPVFSFPSEASKKGWNLWSNFCLLFLVFFYLSTLVQTGIENVGNRILFLFRQVLFISKQFLLHFGASSSPLLTFHLWFPRLANAVKRDENSKSSGECKRSTAKTRFKLLNCSYQKKISQPWMDFSLVRSTEQPGIAKGAHKSFQLFAADLTDRTEAAHFYAQYFPEKTGLRFWRTLRSIRNALFLTYCTHFNCSIILLYAFCDPQTCEEIVVAPAQLNSPHSPAVRSRCQQGASHSMRWCTVGSPTKRSKIRLFLFTQTNPDPSDWRVLTKNTIFFGFL